MAVRVNERSTSEIQFVYEAVQLREFIIIRMTALPPKWRDTLIHPIINLSYEYATELLYVNRLHQRNKHELQLRIDSLVRASAILDSLEAAQVTLLKKLRQNPENIDRQKFTAKTAAQLATATFLEELGKRITKCRDLTDMQRTVDTQLLTDFSREASTS